MQDDDAEMITISRGRLHPVRFGWLGGELHGTIAKVIKLAPWRSSVTMASERINIKGLNPIGK